MGSFLFKWDHAATEVYVTGTFDDWSRSVKLDKKDGSRFEKLVELPNAEEKIYYKFVVDENWTTDHTAPQETDGANNVNNVLRPDQITKSQASSTDQITKSQASSTAPDFGIMSNVTPQSTTAKLAGNVPKEAPQGKSSSPESSGLPGTFPETPATEPSSFSVDPIPATSGIGNPINLRPGEKVPDPSTLTSNTISSTVRDDPSLADAKTTGDSHQRFGVAPLPATSGIGNPINVQPGEKLPNPSTYTQNTINSTVRTDKESYENSSGAPQLPNVVTPQKERDAAGGGLFNLPPVSGTMIPESSLPMGSGTSFEHDPGVTIQSAGANSSTAALAGQVPLEPRSRPKDAGTSSQADTNPTIQSVGPKSTTADLAGKVPLEPKGVPKGADKSFGQGTDATIQSVGVNSTTADLAGKVPLEPKGVPEVVQNSQHVSGFAPEASANPEAVREKSAVEDELESKVPEEPATSEGTGGHATTGVAGSTGKSPEGSTPFPSRGLPASVQRSIDDINKGTPIASTVPDVVQDSITKSNQSPEAAGSKIKVDEKYQVEQELLNEVKTDNAMGDPAPSSSAALTESAPAATSTGAKGATTLAARPAEQNGAYPRHDSREVSPMSHPVKSSQTQPVVTTGVGASKAPQTSQPVASTPKQTPQASSSSKPAQTTNTASASTDKKSKRASGFFGKLKQKFSDKDKKSS